jgi:hypothetical protein
MHPRKLSSLTRAGTKEVGELSGAISALALNANLNPRCSWSILQAYFIEKLLSSRSMKVRHELPTIGVGTPDSSGEPACQEAASRDRHHF